MASNTFYCGGSSSYPTKVEATSSVNNSYSNTQAKITITVTAQFTINTWTSSSGLMCECSCNGELKPPVGQGYNSLHGNGGGTTKYYQSTISTVTYEFIVNKTTSVQSISWSVNIHGSYDMSDKGYQGSLTGSESVSAKPSYSITYNGNGHTGGSTSNQTKYYDENITLRSNGYTKTDHSFTGWNTEANGTGTAYSAGVTYSRNSALSLYAQWKVDYTKCGIPINLSATDNNNNVLTITGQIGANGTSNNAKGVHLYAKFDNATITDDDIHTNGNYDYNMYVSGSAGSNINHDISLEPKSYTFDELGFELNGGINSTTGVYEIREGYMATPDLIPIQGGYTLYSSLPICGIYTYDSSGAFIQRCTHYTSQHWINYNAAYMRVEIKIGQQNDPIADEYYSQEDYENNLVIQNKMAQKISNNDIDDMKQGTVAGRTVATQASYDSDHSRGLFNYIYYSKPSSPIIIRPSVDMTHAPHDFTVLWERPEDGINNPVAGYNLVMQQLEEPFDVYSFDFLNDPDILGCTVKTNKLDINHTYEFKLQSLGTNNNFNSDIITSSILNIIELEPFSDLVFTPSSLDDIKFFENGDNYTNVLHISDDVLRQLLLIKWNAPEGINNIVKVFNAYLIDEDNNQLQYWQSPSNNRGFAISSEHISKDSIESLYKEYRLKIDTLSIYSDEYQNYDNRSEFIFRVYPASGMYIKTKYGFKRAIGFKKLDDGSWIPLRELYHRIDNNELVKSDINIPSFMNNGIALISTNDSYLIDKNEKLLIT